MDGLSPLPLAGAMTVIRLTSLRMSDRKITALVVTSAGSSPLQGRKEATMRTASIFVALGLLVGIAGPAIAAEPQMEDVVYLKNGSIIRGMIVEQIPNEQLKIQTSDGSIFVFTFDEIDRIAKEEAFVRRGEGPKKNAVLAWLLSFIVPGGGQFYNGQNIKGAAMLSLALAGYVPFAVEQIKGEPGNEGLISAGLAIASITWIWSMIDAPVVASRMDYERGYSFYHMPLSEKVSVSISAANEGESYIRAAVCVAF